MEKNEVLDIIQDLAGAGAREQFEEFIETTVEMPVAEYLKKMGLTLEWESKNEVGFGVDLETRDSRVFVKTVELDSSAHQAGINAKDELISIKLRIDSTNKSELFSNLYENKTYDFLLCRLGKIVKVMPLQRFLVRR